MMLIRRPAAAPGALQGQIRQDNAGKTRPCAAPGLLKAIANPLLKAARA